MVDKVTDIGEGRDFCEASIGFFTGEAEDGGVEVDVLTTSKFWVKAASEFEQGGDAAMDCDRALRGLEGSSDNLQEG